MQASSRDLLPPMKRGRSPIDTTPPTINLSQMAMNIHSISTNESLLNPDDFLMSGIVTNTGSIFVATTSNNDLYHHRITYNVSGGASCHACLQQKHSHCDIHQQGFVSTGVPPWVHVFSKSTASSSLCTQCASIAHSE